MPKGTSCRALLPPRLLTDLQRVVYVPEMVRDDAGIERAEGEVHLGHVGVDHPGDVGCPGGKQVRALQPQRMLENLSTKRELHLHGRYGLATYLRASASFGSRRHSRAPSRPQAPQAARDGGWLEPAERASLWRSALSEPYRRNQHLNNSLQTRFQPRHPRGAAVRARRHPASIAISVPLRSGQRVAPAALE